MEKAHKSPAKGSCICRMAPPENFLTFLYIEVYCTCQTLYVEGADSRRTRYESYISPDPAILSVSRRITNPVSHHKANRCPPVSSGGTPIYLTGEGAQDKGRQQASRQPINKRPSTTYPKGGPGVSPRSSGRGAPREDRNSLREFLRNGVLLGYHRMMSDRRLINPSLYYPTTVPRTAERRSTAALSVRRYAIP